MRVLWTVVSFVPGLIAAVTNNDTFPLCVLILDGKFKSWTKEESDILV